MIKQIAPHDSASLWQQAYTQNNLRVPFLSYDWHALWRRVFHKESESLVLSVNDQVITPFVRTKTRIDFSGGEEFADYLDILGPDEKKSDAWSEIISYLKTQGITRIHLRNVPESSATFSFFSNQASASVQKEDTTPIIQMPATWEHYLAMLTRKYRHELERKIRKFEREHPDATFRESENLLKDMHIFLSLMEKDPVKKKFLTAEMKTFFTEMAQAFAPQVSLLILSMGDKHAAATLSFALEGKYYLYNSGFDKTCCANAGFYLKAQSIKRAMEQGFAEYNFLQGSERYKYELGGKDFGVYSIDYPNLSST